VPRVRLQDDQSTPKEAGNEVRAKEVLGGYDVVDASNLDEVLEFAQLIPAVRLGGAVEVRPPVEIPVETAH
jgi:hypothetical protein